MRGSFYKYTAIRRFGILIINTESLHNPFTFRWYIQDITIDPMEVDHEIILKAKSGWIVLAGAAVYANGRNEAGQGPGPRGQQNPQDLELVKVEGELQFGNFGEPYIVQEDIAYVLRVPYAAGTELDNIKAGDKIVVEGYEMPMRRFWNQDKTRILRVVKGSVNGKEIDIDKLVEDCPYYDDGRFGRHGNRGGMMGPRGGMHDGGWGRR